MLGFIDKIRTKYRKHDFDLKEPYKIEEVMGYKFTFYKCKNCDKTLGLDLWQMKILPPSMARGCKGR